MIENSISEDGIKSRSILNYNESVVRRLLDEELITRDQVLSHFKITDEALTDGLSRLNKFTELLCNNTKYTVVTDMDGSYGIYDDLGFMRVPHAWSNRLDAVSELIYFNKLNTLERPFMEEILTMEQIDALEFLLLQREAIYIPELELYDQIKRLEGYIQVTDFQQSYRDQNGNCTELSRIVRLVAFDTSNRLLLKYFNI